MWNLKLLGVATTITLTLLAGSAWLAYSKGKAYGMQQVQTLWNSERAIQLAAQAEAEMKARQTEQALQQTINRIKQEKTREATRLANDYAAVLHSLHDREDRPRDGGLPEGASAGAESARGCTGAELYRDDAAFLAGQANAADQLRLALKACVAHAAAVERELNKE
jgi:hypothetical protein